MTVALYARVSTDEQAEHGHSIDAQKERLIAYAQSQGWDEYRLYVDEGYSGTTMERPALKSLLRHIEQKQVDTVIVYRLDRLSRKQRDVLFLLEDVFNPNEVIFKSVTEPFDTGTPLGKAMIGILAVFAQLERDTIAERTQEGQRKRIQKGLWHGGRAPFGYDYNQELGKLEINEDEARLVRSVFRRYLNHASLTKLSDWLASYDDSRAWSFVTVRQLLGRETYLGHTQWGANVSKDSHEPIIDPETFDRVQRMTEHRKEGHPRRRKHLLAGVLKCGACGNRMFHRQYTRRPYFYKYYACEFSEMARKQRERRGHNERCTLPKIRAEKIEPYVVKELLRLAEVDVTELEQMLHTQDTPEDEDELLQEQLRTRIAEFDKRIDRWYEAFERGDISSTRANERVTELEAERLELVQQLNKLEINEVPKTSSAEFYDAMTLIRDSWEEMNQEEQRQVLQSAIRSITVHPNHQIDIEWNI